MATTNANFVVGGTAGLNGASVVAAPYIKAVDRTTADILTGRGPGGTATAHLLADRTGSDLSVAGYAKNGAAVYTLTGTTPVDADLFAMATNATSQTGDTTFASWSKLIINNTGPAALTIKQGASNPANLMGISTTPALTIPAGGSIVLTHPTGQAISATARLITITPAATGQVAICVGGQ